LDCSEKGRKRGGRGPDGNVKYPFSGNGPEINPIPNSTGLAFGERALCPQGPAGLLSFCWNRLQTEARFWEKKRGGVKKMKMARMRGICLKAFNRAMTFTQIMILELGLFWFISTGASKSLAKDTSFPPHPVNPQSILAAMT
jgi:hypothetical protein